MNHIGERLKELRTARGLSQTEFAKRLGVTGAAVSSYENSIRLPSYEVLLKMARLFHVTTDTLLGFSTRHVVDVTTLTARQRGAVQELIAAYELSNRCVELLRSDDQYARALQTLDLEPESL